MSGCMISLRESRTDPTHKYFTCLSVVLSSLEALRKAISKLIDIPLDNLILFHSSGSQLSESLYQELGHHAASESFNRTKDQANPLEHPTSHPGSHRHNLASVQYDLNGNEIRSDGDNGGSGTALFAFDRESFMADPHEFVRGIEEDLLLPEALPCESRLEDSAGIPRTTLIRLSHQPIRGFTLPMMS